MAPTLAYPPKPQRGDAIAVLSPSWGGPAPLACRRASAGRPGGSVRLVTAPRPVTGERLPGAGGVGR